MSTINGIKPIGNPNDIRAIEDGIACRYYFDNGHGASVIQHRYSYGGPQGLWELAVLKTDTVGNYYLCYETPITDDVIGNLTPEEVEVLLERIAALPAITH